MISPSLVSFCLFYFLLIPVSHAEDAIKNKSNLDAIIQSVERLCKAPTDKKSSHYKVEAKGEVDIRVKIVGLLGGSAVFTKEEYTVFQRVLQEHQATDNESFRKCSVALTPMFIEKFHASSSPELVNPIVTVNPVIKVTVDAPKNTAPSVLKTNPVFNTNGVVGAMSLS